MISKLAMEKALISRADTHERPICCEGKNDNFAGNCKRLLDVGKSVGIIVECTPVSRLLAPRVRSLQSNYLVSLLLIVLCYYSITQVITDARSAYIS